MPSYFANPLGLLGLLAVPAILIIHLLRERSRRVRVSTLFLLERLAPRTPKGWKLHFIQNSLPLWLQLLIALCCAWLLAQPRWLRNDSRQRVTVIFDNTASMSAFRDRVLAELPPILGTVARAAAYTDWSFVTTDEPEFPLYHGPELREALPSLDRWRPVLTNHDPARAFSLALLDLRRGGSILFVTDRLPDALPAGVNLLAFGSPIENCGFAGVRTWTEEDGAHWEVLIKNNGSSAQVRQWWLESDKVRSQPRNLSLNPGQLVSIPGPFPPGEKRVTVHLSPDQFALDDVLPLVAPEPKRLSVFIHAGPVATRFAQRVVKTIPGAKPAPDAAGADAAIVSAVDDATIPADHCAVVVGTAAGTGARLAVGGFTAERHPFTDGLVWDGLLSTGYGALVREASDLPLLWQSAQPLIFLRTHGNARRLFLNFDFESSNADRLPAAVLLTARFLTGIQEEKPERFADNFETNQLLPPFPANAGISPAAASATRRTPGELRSPLQPGFFQVREDGGTLLDGAAHFGDPREADFRDAFSTPAELSRASLVRQENTVGDRLAPFWMLVIGAALTGSWVKRK